MFKHKNFNGNGFNGSKPFFKKQRNVNQYRGTVNQTDKPFAENASFQVNRFKDCISLRFNSIFIKELLKICDKEYKDSVVNELIHDLEDILLNINNECFISASYHVGKIGKCIYINMNNDCGLRFYDALNKINSFPPFILAFKQKLEKLCIQSRNYQSNYENDEDFNFNC